MKAELTKNGEKKIFSSWWVIHLFGKTMGNVRNQRDINLIIARTRRNYLVSETNHKFRKFINDRNE